MRPSTVLLFVASIGISSAPALPNGETADHSASGAAGDIGAIIPADRRVDWTHTTGVPGGIPKWTRICATIDAATYGSGVADATGAIQTAVDRCATSAPGTEPGPGVIAIPAGTYRLDGSVKIDKSYTVIRGAGADQTTFVAGGQAFSVGVNGVAFKNIAIRAGATKGSTELTLANISDLAVGQLIAISADNEPGLVFASRSSTHDSKQMALITAISGNTITVTPPLIWSFSPNPVLLYRFIGINRFVGLEDMRVDHVQGKSGASFMLDQCYGCWVRGIYSYKPGGYHSYVLDSLLGEIRDCYFLDSQSYGPNNAGLNVRGTTNGGVNQGAVTGFKFENNIFDKTFPGIVLQNASSGNYVGYNYGYATQAGNHMPGDSYVAWNAGMFNDNHGPHDMMNLWEGNTGEQFTSDGYFGSASHGTLFRNYFTGLNPRLQIAWNAISLNRWAYHYNVVGNVLGVYSPATATYQFSDPANCNAGKGIYRLGFPNTGNCSLTPFDGASPPGIDTTVIATLLRWGNFDTKHNGAVWDAAEIPIGVPVPATQHLPASIYYDRRPSWWPAAIAWPPIGPDVTGGELLAGQAWKIPAQRCYESQNLGGGGAFSRATCYGQPALPGDLIYLPALVNDNGGGTGSRPAALPDGASAASPCPADALLCEDFEDADFAARGWYDAPRGAISAAEHAPGSAQSFECSYNQGATGCQGGTPARHGFDPTESLYVEYWVKYGPGFVGSGRPYHPHEFVFMTNKDGPYVGPAATHLTTYMEQLAGVPRLGLQDLQNVDTRCILRNDDSFVGCNGDFASFPFTELRSVAACNGIVGDLDKRDCFPTGGGRWYSSRVWDAPAGASLYDGAWHRVAALFRMNRIVDGKGVADGALRYWLDGRLLMRYDHILFRTGANADQQFNQVLLAPYIGDGSPLRQTMWIDDLRILRDGDGGPSPEPSTEPTGTPSPTPTREPTPAATGSPSPSPAPRSRIHLPFARRGGMAVALR